VIEANAAHPGCTFRDRTFVAAGITAKAPLGDRLHELWRRDGRSLFEDLCECSHTANIGAREADRELYCSAASVDKRPTCHAV
jgi:hypothetical protein